MRREEMIHAMGSKSMRAAALSAANRELEAHIAERTRQLAGSQADDFTRDLKARYEKATGKAPDIYVCQAAAGAGVA